ncbi:hypothetical protein E6O75_ATG09908 [Venturia nashicola]|uniref:Uncharacterized protein n=1 Tax=Venturia nashicola TaxID=86259 RepID=A0A4Z1NZU1_9PEZI|nr:hypothetical protein E6O75_ATG09908 [Venturia nashicola]
MDYGLWTVEILEKTSHNTKRPAQPCKGFVLALCLLCADSADPESVHDHRMTDMIMATSNETRSYIPVIRSGIVDEACFSQSLHGPAHSVGNGDDVRFNGTSFKDCALLKAYKTEVMDGVATDRMHTVDLNLSCTTAFWKGVPVKSVICVGRVFKLFRGALEQLSYQTKQRLEARDDHYQDTEDANSGNKVQVHHSESR